MLLPGDLWRGTGEAPAGVLIGAGRWSDKRVRLGKGGVAAGRRPAMTRCMNRVELAARIEGADPRARHYLVLRWRDCRPTLAPYDAYPPQLWSAAICRWAALELDRIEALIVRLDP